MQKKNTKMVVNTKFDMQKLNKAARIINEYIKMVESSNNNTCAKNYNNSSFSMVEDLKPLPDYILLYVAFHTIIVSCTFIEVMYIMVKNIVELTYNTN